MARVTEERVKELIAEAITAQAMEVRTALVPIQESQAKSDMSIRRLEAMMEVVTNAVGDIRSTVLELVEYRQKDAVAARSPIVVDGTVTDRIESPRGNEEAEAKVVRVGDNPSAEQPRLPSELPSTPPSERPDAWKAAITELRQELRTDLYTMFATKAKPRRRLVGDRARPKGTRVGRDLSDAFEDFEDSDDAHLEGSEESDVSENDEDIERAMNRRESYIQRVKDFDKQSQDQRAVVITRAQPSADHIKLTYLSVRAALGFARDIDCYLSKERVALSAPAYVDPKIIELIMSKNSKIRTVSNFYKLTNPELLTAIQRTIRPATVQEFIHALERNVEFDMPGNVPPSWSRFKTFSNQLYVFRDQFLETYMYLIKGCSFEKDLKFDVKTDGSVVKIFLDAIPGKYARVLMRSGRREFDSLKDFFAYFFKMVSKHKKLASEAYNLASTYFADEDKSKRPDQKKARGSFGQSGSKPQFKKLNQIGALMDDDEIPDFEELQEHAVTVDESAANAADDPGADTDYFDDNGDSEPSSPTGFDPASGVAVNAVVPSKPPMILQRPAYPAKPAALGSGAAVKPGGTATANACFQFATTGVCTRRECTYSHDPKVVMLFLEETMQKSASRLKELQGRK
jgi:hypothetical protein